MHGRRGWGDQFCPDWSGGGLQTPKPKKKKIPIKSWLPSQILEWKPTPEDLIAEDLLRTAIAQLTLSLQTLQVQKLKYYFSNTEGSRICLLRVPFSQKQLLLRIESQKVLSGFQKCEERLKAQCTRSSPWYWDLGFWLISTLALCACKLNSSALALSICSAWTRPTPYPAHSSILALTMLCEGVFIYTLTSPPGLSSLRLARTFYIFVHEVHKLV